MGYNFAMTSEDHLKKVRGRKKETETVPYFDTSISHDELYKIPVRNPLTDEERLKIDQFERKKLERQKEETSLNSKPRSPSIYESPRSRSSSIYETPRSSVSEPARTSVVRNETPRSSVSEPVRTSVGRNSYGDIGEMKVVGFTMDKPVKTGSKLTNLAVGGLGALGGMAGSWAGGKIGGLFGEKGKKIGRGIGGVLGTGAGLIGGSMLRFKKGGRVGKKSKAILHKDEFVLPKGVKPTKSQLKKVKKLGGRV